MSRENDKAQRENRSQNQQNRESDQKQRENRSQKEDRK